MRNYIAESIKSGTSVKQIASELKISQKWVNYYAENDVSLPKKIYESARNISRRSAYQYLRQHGFDPQQAKQRQRSPSPEINADVEFIDDVVENIYYRWNAKHLDPNDPKHLTRYDIRKRIEKGIQNGKSREDIEEY